MNIIRDRWRAKKRRGSKVNLEDVNPEELSIEDFTDTLSVKNQIEEAMTKLTKEQQLVIELRVIKGFSIAETAKMMQKSDGAIRVLQYRALKALAKRLEEI